MHMYVINLTDVEQKAMEYISTDVDFWIQNAVHERARLAMEELVNDDVREKLAAGKSVKGNKEDIAMKSNLPNAQARNAANMEKMKTVPRAEPDVVYGEPQPE
jgi:hypothetical protein